MVFQSALPYKFAVSSFKMHDKKCALNDEKDSKYPNKSQKILLEICQHLDARIYIKDEG